MGEQGAESVHALMMKMDRTYHSIPDELDRLKYTMREHAISTAPSLLGLRPPPAKRKKVTDDSDSDSDSSDEEAPQESEEHTHST